MCSKSRLLFVCRSCLLEDGIICTLLVPENKKLCKKEFCDLLTINLRIGPQLKSLDKEKENLKRLHSKESRIRRLNVLNLKFQKEDLAFKLKNLQKLYEKRKQGLREEKRNFQDQKYMVDLLKKSTLVSKMDKIRKKLSDLQVKLQQKKRKVFERNQYIKKLQSYHMKNLSKYILPIGPINDLMSNKDDLSSYDNTESTDGNTSALRLELLEAKNFVYDEGRWLMADDSRMYICNEEIVVKTDDFTFSHVSMLYENTYKTKNRSRTVSGSSDTHGDGLQVEVERDTRHTYKEAFFISLSYCAHMMNVMQSIMSPVQLPHKLHLKTFYEHGMGESVFTCYYKLLIGNICALCMQQKVSIQSPHRFLTNMRMLADKICEEGCSSGPYKYPQEKIDQWESDLKFHEIKADNLIYNFEEDDDETSGISLRGWAVFESDKDFRLLSPPTSLYSRNMDQSTSIVSSALSTLSYLGKMMMFSNNNEQ